MPSPRIFVSHSHKDDAFTERLVADLRQAGATAWMDKTDLGAGNFQQRISDALANCDWFVLVLTRDALASPWVREEIYAANRLKQQGQIHGLIFLQAGPLDHRELPPLWSVFNILDATKDYAAALNRTLSEVGFELIPAAASVASRGVQGSKNVPRRFVELGFEAVPPDTDETLYIVQSLCFVPAGPFLMGSNPKRDPVAQDDWTEDERPQHTVTLPAYELARFPVTVAEYACFVRAGQRVPKDWQAQLGKLDHPVVNVTWYDAVSYTAWLTEQTRQTWQLPTEAEWEKAARGIDGRTYPWGDTFDKNRCNTSESGINSTTPVGMYPSGASPFGAQDMAGNVWEWTSSRLRPYPYTTTDERGNMDLTDVRVLRGGSWDDDARHTRAAYRYPIRPYHFDFGTGFRVVRAVPSS